MPCRHILAGIAYFWASLRRAGLADGCCDARKKSWCSCRSVRWRAIRACHCSLLSPAAASFARVDFDTFGLCHYQTSVYAFHFSHQLLLK